MAKRDLEEVVSALRHDANQKARRQALLVPWRKVQQSAADYVDWLGFSLWIRAARIASPRMPTMIRAALESRCAGFLDVAENVWPEGDIAFWRRLNDWIESREFTGAKREGWFDAVLYYAYADIGCEQAWLNWESAASTWQNCPPAQMPSFDEWRQHVPVTESRQDDLRSLALQQRHHVQGEVLATAVSSLIEARACGRWIASCCEPERVLPESIADELERSIPELAKNRAPLICDRSLILDVIRRASGPWRTRASEGNWSAVLRYSMITHPRYHRIVHYFEKSEDQRLSSGAGRRISTFADWLNAADRYQFRGTRDNES